MSSSCHLTPSLTSSLAKLALQHPLALLDQPGPTLVGERHSTAGNAPCPWRPERARVRIGMPRTPQHDDVRRQPWPLSPSPFSSERHWATAAHQTRSIVGVSAAAVAIIDTVRHGRAVHHSPPTKFGTVPPRCCRQEVRQEPQHSVVPSISSLRRRDHRAMVDPKLAPTAPRVAIKGERTWTKSSRTSLPLFLLIILGPSPIHIER
jgi:hypothetical protein